MKQLVEKLLIRVRRCTQSVGILFSIGLLFFLFNSTTIFSQNQTQTFNSSGSIFILGGSNVTVEVWGAGGAGGNASERLENGGGGGGGAYATYSFVATNSNTYNYVVGLAGSQSGNADGGNSFFYLDAGSNFVEAEGGKAGGNSPGDETAGFGGSGGTYHGFPGVLGANGGNGADGVYNSYSGAGGASAGTNGTPQPGGNAIGMAGGIPPTDGGAGADGRPVNHQSDGYAATEVGGGGGGATKRGGGSQSYIGGDGANGQVRITITCPDFSLSNTRAILPTASGETFDVSISGTLPDGNYTITYDLSSPNAVSGATASMAVSGGMNSGTFSIPDLTEAGETTITITNISSGECSTDITDNNTSVFSNEPQIGVLADGVTVDYKSVFDGIFSFDQRTDFGFVEVGRTLSQTYTIQNFLSGPLNIADVEINLEFGDVSQFTLDKSNIEATPTIAGFSSITFTIDYTPTTVGATAVQIKIYSNDPTVDEFTYWINGNGADASPYCAPWKLQGNKGNPHYISEVEFGSFVNATTRGPGRYNNFSDTSVYDAIHADRGTSLDGFITVTVDGANTDANELTFWIDFDQDANDGGLENTEAYTIAVQDLTVVNGTKEIRLPVSIPIPSDALLGDTRMRIAFMEEGSNYDACDYNKNSGEVEDYTVTITDCAVNRWTASIDEDWNNAGNWSCNEVPNSISKGGVLVQAGVAAPIIYKGDAPGYAFDLVIESGATVVVEDNYLEIEDDLKIDGEIILSGDGQLLQQTGSSFDDDSLGQLVRNQEGTADLYTYNYWSSPVYKNYSVKVGYGASRKYNYTIEEVLPDINFIGGYNGSAGPPVALASYWLWKFVDGAANDYSEWQHVQHTGDVIAGEGFTMKGPGSGGITDLQAYSFKGKPINGDVELDISAGSEYLLGNPYPSALDADQFILDNIAVVEGEPTFDGTLYFWEHWGGGSHALAAYEGGYATYNLSGGVGSGNPASGSGTGKVPGRFVPVAQGFFVNSVAGGTIQFNNGQRAFQIEDGPNSLFMKPGNNTASKSKDTRKKLRLGIVLNKDMEKEILLTEDSRTTMGMDYGFDALLQDGYSNDIYWIVDNKNFIIQGVPKIAKNSVFELGVQMEIAGTLEIKLNSFTNSPDLKDVYLIDREADKTHKLSTNSISLELEKGDYKGRFAISFLPKVKNVGELEDLEDVVQVIMNNDTSELQITKIADVDINEVALFNVLGQKVQSEVNGFNQRYFTIPVYQNEGVYFLQINSEFGNFNQRIMVK